MKASPVLQTLDLSAGYPGRTLFSGLNLQLNAGELVCFMGPNGAGKSTLIRTIAGIQKPISGSLRFKGTEIVSYKMRTNVSLVLTDSVVAPYMTVYDLVTYGRYPHTDWKLKLSEKDHQIIKSAIREVQIEHLSNRKLHELSDGQKQMAMIARALAQETDVLLMDEPTAHLDLNNRVEIMKLLKQITRATGKVVLMATHELDLALQTADLIWLAGNDDKISTGIPEDLVLRGVFDQVFQFKGFDLRTGRVQHEAFRKKTVTLRGSGYYYLWTRNLIERNGFSLVENNGDIDIAIDESHEAAIWISEGERFISLQHLLEKLITSD